MKKINTLKSSKSKCLNGIISVPGDKSISHRAIMLSSLCYGSVKIYGLLEATDVQNTIKAIKSLGIKIVKKKNFYQVFGNGGNFKKTSNYLDFGNSGTGARLMIGMLSTKSIEITFIGDESLSKRPMSRITEPLKKFGVRVDNTNGFLPVKLEQSDFLFTNSFDIKIASAQVKSAVILACLNLKGETIINEYSPSRNHTEILLKHLGAKINVKKTDKKNIITISGPNTLKPKDIFIPGDISSAAFLIVACLLCEESLIKIKSVGINYLRTGLIDVLKKMKGKIFITKTWEVNGEKFADINIETSQLIGCTVNSNISARLIDEFPILFVAASFAKGITKFSNLNELKFKESDRLTTMAKSLKKCGVKLELGENSIRIYGKNIQTGGVTICTENDHRIAMSMLIFGLRAEKPIKVDKIEMIETSFPGFYELLKKIGSKIEFV